MAKRPSFLIIRTRTSQGGFDVELLKTRPGGTNVSMGKRHFRTEKAAAENVRKLKARTLARNPGKTVEVVRRRQRKG